MSLSGLLEVHLQFYFCIQRLAQRFLQLFVIISKVIVDTLTKAKLFQKHAAHVVDQM